MLAASYMHAQLQQRSEEDGRDVVRKVWVVVVVVVVGLRTAGRGVIHSWSERRLDRGKMLDPEA